MPGWAEGEDGISARPRESPNCLATPSQALLHTFSSSSILLAVSNSEVFVGVGVLVEM